MEIKKIADLALLIEQLNNNNVDDKFIDLNGLAKYKDSIFNAIEAVYNEQLKENLKPGEEVLYNVLKDVPSNRIKALKNATLTSYYTPLEIADQAVTPILQHLRKENKQILNVLEPSAGNGRLLYNIEDDDLVITAVEKEPLTAEILKHNAPFFRPTVNVIDSALEKTELKRNHYDIIIGNVPFGNVDVFDENLVEQRKLYAGNIHSYFFVRAIEELKPGGMLSLITTASMIDQKGLLPLREYIAENTNIINISRFDNSLFQDAGTKVLTDLIILQKPVTPKLEIKDSEKPFLEITPFGTKGYNSIFDTPLGHVFGDLAIGQGYLGHDALIVNNDPFNNALDGKLSNTINKAIKERCFSVPLKQTVALEPKVQDDKSSEFTNWVLHDYPHHSMGNIIYYSGAFYVTVPAKDNLTEIHLKDITIPNSETARTLAILELRDLYKAMVAEMRKGDDYLDKATEHQQSFVNAYDQFSFFYGELNLKPNKDIWRKDIDSDIIQSLEILNGSYYEKAQIFTKKLESLNKVTIDIKNVNDAILFSLNSHGTINEDFISSNYKKDWIKEALDQELIFINPVIRGFDVTNISNYTLTTKEEFQSGYIEGKYKLYQNANDLLKNNKYAKFVTKKNLQSAKDLLVEKMPIKLDIDQIDPSLGENWMPLKIYQDFAKELFNDPSLTIRFRAQLDMFSVKNSYTTEARSNYSVTRSSGRTIAPNTMLEWTLQQSIPQITKTVEDINGNKKNVFDRPAYDAAMNVFKSINDSFSEWIRLEKQQHLHPQIERLYHLKNNAIVKQEYKAPHITYEGLNPNIIPYDIQNNCAWQMAQNNGGIIDHKVGHGKTISMVLSNHLKKKYGKIKKELIVGLNANYVDLYESCKSLFPNGKYLLVRPEDVTPSKKIATFFKIANNDYDAVICAHSSLMFFPPSPETEMEMYDEIIKETSNTLSEDQSEKFLTRSSRNQLEKKLATAQAKYEFSRHIINQKKVKNTIVWNDLGIDAITVDESQFFKNLTFNTRHSRVAGLGSQSETQKTSNLLTYIRACQETHYNRTGIPDQGATFVSGTTISNSITELYLMFKYLTPKHLESKNINCFDQWARQYARKESSYEMSLDGKVKLKERFRFFVKVPELAKDYARICNYSDDSTFKIDKPKLVHNLIDIQPTKDQELYFEELRNFAETKDPSNLIGISDTDNVRKAAGLIATSQGKKAALDMRLIDTSFENDPNSKINIMAAKVAKIYNEYDEDKGTQLIFLDSGTPTSKNFNLYASIKEELIHVGIKPEEIQFIHSFKKRKLAKLFDDVNSGKVRVLLGSTSKMGVGVNAQKQLVAMHHLDFPWRPTDLEQRNGRGDRQGNELLPKYDNTIPSYYYATANSLDAYTLNLLQIKQNFIEQFKGANTSVRTFDEGVIDANGSIPIDMFQSIVSGDQTLLQLNTAENRLSDLLHKEAAFKKQHASIQWKYDDAQKSLVGNQKTVKALSADAESASTLIEDFTNNIFSVNNTVFDSQDKMGIYIKNRLSQILLNPNKEHEYPVLFKNDFQLVMRPADRWEQLSPDNYSLFLKTPNNIMISYGRSRIVKDNKEMALFHMNAISKISSLIENHQKRIRDYKSDILVYEKTLSNTFSQKGDIKDVKDEINFLKQKMEKTKEQNKNKKEDKNNKKNDDRNDNRNDNNIQRMELPKIKVGVKM